MSYTKTVWQDRQVTFPLRFTQTLVSGTTYDLVPAEGTVIQSGTAINATNLNNIENGIETLDLGKVNKSGDSMTGILTVTTGGGQFVAKSNQVGMDGNAYMEFKDSAGSRYGFVGKSTSANNNIIIYADLGDVELYTASGSVKVSDDLVVTGTVSVPDLVKINAGTSSFKGSGTSLIVGGGGSSIFLRPNGDASTTGQLQISSTGNVSVNGGLTITSASTLNTGKIDISRSGIAYTGTSTLGDYTLNLNNSDIIGANGIHFNDSSAAFGEGLMWLYSTATAGSTTKADYDCLRVLDSTLYIDVAGTLATKGIDFNSTGTITIQSLDTFTTSNSANVYSSATGVIQRSTSSLRYKTNVVDVPKDKYDKVLDLRPVLYTSKGEADNPDWTYTGFIAEEVHEVEPRFVMYRENPDGSGDLQPDGVQYDRIAVYLTAVVKEQRNKIIELEQRIIQLENK